MPTEKTSQGAEVINLADALLALTTPTQEAVSKVLGIELQPTSRTKQYAGVFPRGPFERARLRVEPGTGILGILILDARKEPPTPKADINFEKYEPPQEPGKPPRPPRPGTPNPHVPPEGIISYGYQPKEKAALAFQFTAKSSKLHAVSFEWSKDPYVKR